MGDFPAFRIVRWELKVLYIVVAWIVGYAIADLLRRLEVAPSVISVVDIVVTLASFALAVRVFRGRGEPIDPPRAWWRMTGWRRLSLRLGSLFGALAALSLVCLVGEITGAVTASYGVTGWLGLTLQYGVLAFFYFNSAAHMARLGIARPPKPLKFRPTIKW
ncbi:hypothetical protein [Agromyces sp. CCNWLW203]|uniref:hypothetical protein n=1 Tax=Agromyces sp. CCNWLW203 TaxID=3112842 RepID=UPI002F968C81